MNTTTPAPKQIIINPTPKTRFLASAPIILSKHRDMVSSDGFQLSADHALLEYVRVNCENDDGNPQNRLAAFHRIQGALEFIGCMKKLAEQNPPPSTADKTPANLNHRV